MFYTLYFPTAVDVPETSGELLARVFYACQTCTVRAVGRSPSFVSALLLSPRTFEKTRAASEAEDIFEVLIDDDATGTKLTVCDLDPQSYARKVVWLSIVGVDEVENLLGAVSQTYKDCLVKSSETHKEKHGSGLIALSSLSSEKFDTVSSHGMVEGSEKSAFSSQISCFLLLTVVIVSFQLESWALLNGRIRSALCGLFERSLWQLLAQQLSWTTAC